MLSRGSVASSAIADMRALVTEGATPIVAPPIDCTPGAGPAEAGPPREAIMSETNTTHTTNSRMLLKWLRENDADRDNSDGDAGDK